jgi:tRNA 2-selenouridine synthase
MAAGIVEIGTIAHSLGEFDTLIDVRSPSEFADDHLPGAVNWPVLDDDQRRTVGTLYVQSSPLAARKIGAAMVARNIAAHLERWVQDRPRDWRPLVYCWRGGQRSGAMAWFLDQIGFRTVQLKGGYKGFRALVRAELGTLPQRLDFHVVAGRTGSGKTRLLHALAARGAQVLDLEALASHRGSILGGLPDRPQPSQKRFDTLLWQALSGLDPARPVFVESESRRVGAVQLPDALIERMRVSARCLRVETDDAARVRLLLDDYGFFADDPERFCRLLDGLVELRGRDQVARWKALARAGDWAGVFGALMREHYDPLYRRSIDRHFAGYRDARVLTLDDAGPAALHAAAQRLLEELEPCASTAAPPLDA